MKKILIGFIAIGLLTFVGCEKDDDTDTTDSTETTSDDGGRDSDTGDESTDTDSGDGTTDSSETSSDDGSTDSDADSDDDTTDTSSDEGTTDDSSVEYGEGVTDIDGNTYKSVIIGDQEWMAENLRTSKYSDGTAIHNITDDWQWEDLSVGAWCHYDNDSQYDSIYGKLYNWPAVNNWRNACPTGWHVPTDAEWTKLENYLSNNGHEETEGRALKSKSEWFGSTANGTDDFGWNGLPGGNRIGYGSYHNKLLYGAWWSSSTKYTYALCRKLNPYNKIDSHYMSKDNGLSIRCVKNY